MRFGSCYLDLATKCFDLVDVGFASPERWRELEDEKKETAAFVPAGLLRLLRWLAQRDEAGLTAEEAAAGKTDGAEGPATSEGVAGPATGTAENETDGADGGPALSEPTGMGSEELAGTMGIRTEGEIQGGTASLWTAEESDSAVARAPQY